MVGFGARQNRTEVEMRDGVLHGLRTEAAWLVGDEMRWDGGLTCGAWSHASYRQGAHP